MNVAVAGKQNQDHSTTTIGVIIPTINRGFACYNTVLNLQAGIRMPDEILIVDQTPPNERNPILMREQARLFENPRIRLLQRAEPNAAKARNEGDRQATSEVLVFIDDDVFVPDAFVDRYAAIFSDPAVAAATGMILAGERDDGTFKPLARMVSKPHLHNMLRGGNFAIRKTVWEAVGGMDEHFQGACQHEDWDLAARLEEKKFQVIWDPGPWVFHLALPGGGRRDHARRLWDGMYNVAYFASRHPRLMSPHTLWRTLLRYRVFNRDARLRPWTIPGRFWMLMRAMRIAARTAAEAALMEPMRKHKEEGHATNGR